jgi:uncharacterized membrane protein
MSSLQVEPRYQSRAVCVYALLLIGFLASFGVYVHGQAERRLSPQAIVRKQPDLWFRAPNMVCVCSGGLSP